MTCEDCLHKNVCYTVLKFGLSCFDSESPIETFCMEFKNKADYTKVVRCKDCVSRVEFEPNKFHCENTGYYCGETGYCSDGVRKEEIK